LTARARDGRLATTTSAPISITVTNLPPTATLTAPAGGSSYTYPATINLAAIASDPEGTVSKVEFYDGTIKIGEDFDAPYTLVWQPLGGGKHALTARAIDGFGAAGNSAAVTVSVSRLSTQAYVVPAATVGGQNYSDGLGMDFDVLAPIVITKLGVFDSSGNGISFSLTVQLFRRTTSTALLTTMSFASGSGTLAAGTASRMKPLANPLVLPIGSYTIVSYGHNSSDLNGNAGLQTKVWTTDGGGGLLQFTGSRYGGSPNLLPPNMDALTDQYAAGTFDYMSLDGDGDGLPYDWEIANGLNPNVADANSDNDGDGATNLAEYLAGTNPRSAASVLRPTVTSSGGSIHVTFLARANRNYTIQRSNDFATWTNVFTAPAQGSDHSVDFADPIAGSQRFYRVKPTGP
jgi:hypothetical protein